MKRIFTFLAILATINLFGQSERVILVEQFTQASCGPCAGTNPVIFPIMESNKDKVASIAYQVSWPGYDPMHEQNPGPVNSRVSYYGIRAVPGTAFNGAYDRNNSSTAVVTQANINAATSESASFDLDLQVEPYVNFKGLNIDLNIEATANASGSLVAHVVVIEDEINFQSPPGSNGETHFRWVMKEMLPHSGGTAISSDWVTGNTESISLSYDFENFYDWKNAGVVAFIQDNNSKKVMQAVYWQPSFEPNTGDDVLVTGASASGNLSAEFDIVCGGTTSPVVWIMNSGETNLTSCDIEYSINGSATQTYNWTGNLATFAETQVNLPAIDFPIDFVGELDVNVMQPNGSTDQYPDNGLLITDFLAAPNATTKATFEIRPLLKPDEMSFKITDSNGDIVLEDGPFDSRGSKVYDLDLNENECYSIEVINNYSSVNGTYNVRNEDNSVVLSETVVGNVTLRSDFGSYTSISTKNLTSVDSWSIIPNPVFDQVNLKVLLNEAVNLDVIVTDVVGNVVASSMIGGFNGEHSKSVDVRHLNNGIYFVTLKNGDRISVKKVVKQ